MNTPNEPSAGDGGDDTVLARVRRAATAAFTRSISAPRCCGDRNELRQLHARVDALDFRVRAIEQRESS